MARFLNSKSLKREIDRLLNYKSDYLYIISPYIKGDELYEFLEDMHYEDTDVNIVYGKTKMNKGNYYDIMDFPNTRLYYLEDLHAKVFLNDSAAIISTMNLYDYSFDNNTECGVMFYRKDSDGHTDVYDFVRNEVVKKACLIKSFD